ncbi:MAG: 5-oxoprolinase subunit PxpB [Proteobacteria bacterium]|nr:5-oxoprolinase subunit PxpB [Pseudomonadota bacterium]
MNDVHIEWLGDRALLLRLGAGIDATLNACVHALAHTLREAALPGVVDIVPAYASVAVHYDPRAWSEPAASTAPGERLAQRLLEIAAALPAPARTALSAEQGTVLEIPVCYGGEHGPDLADVAGLAGVGADEVIARHVAGDYRVAMLGFAPGFPYLLGLDPALHAPRRANPRTRVPAGSVAIGGAQTGIYPRELPGGWQILGRTPLTLFDAARDPPALLAPGQRVRFRAIDADKFAWLQKSAGARPSRASREGFSAIEPCFFAADESEAGRDKSRPYDAGQPR